MRSWTLPIVLVANTGILALAVNPWWRELSYEALLALIIEGFFLVVVGLPIYIHQRVRNERSVRESLAATFETIMDFVTGAV